MIEFLISMLVLAIIIYVVVLVVGMLPLPPQVKTIVYLIVGVILLVAVLNQAGIYDFGHGHLVR
jgi:hypothetical protein